MTLQEAIAKAGNQAKLARILNITVANVSQWKKAGKMPEKHIPKLQEAFDSQKQAA